MMVEDLVVAEGAAEVVVAVAVALVMKVSGSLISFSWLLKLCVACTPCQQYAASGYRNTEERIECM